ncbi:MAG: DNA repair protein RecO C-terminal domain-containing protein [Rikenellaceae bacterium]
MSEEYKSRAIILHTIKHGDNGHIVYMYSQHYARISCYVNSSRSGRPLIGKSKIALQPLTMIDYVGSKSMRGEFHRLSQVKRAYVPDSMVFDINKSTVALFMGEVIYKIVRDVEPDPLLFDFLYSSIVSLDKLHGGEASYHLYFMTKLLPFLGYCPQNTYMENSFFDMKRSLFVVIRPSHPNYFEVSESRLFSRFISADLTVLPEIKCGRALRVSLLNNIISYISLHHETNYNIVSLKILSEIF